MSLIRAEDNPGFLTKQVNCCLCGKYSGYNVSIFALFSSSFSVVCRVGYGCRKTCSCDMPLVSKEISIQTINEEFYNCNRCQKIGLIKNKI